MELETEAERKQSHLGVAERGREGGQRWRKKGRNCWRFRIIKEVGLEAFTGNRWQREAGWESGKK